MQKMLRQKNSGGMEEKRKQLKDKLSKVEDNLSKMNNKRDLHKVPKKLVTGDKVFIHTLNQSGIVVNPPDKKGDVTIRAGIMTVKVNISNLSLDKTEDVSSKVTAKKYSMNVKSRKSQHISPEVDLRGLMVEEAIDKTDKYLDDAYLAGISPVTVIHGKGTGALRSAIQEFLRTNPHVKSFRLGQYGEGEAGVTIVELK